VKYPAPTHKKEAPMTGTKNQVDRVERFKKIKSLLDTTSIYNGEEILKIMKDPAICAHLRREGVISVNEDNEYLWSWGKSISKKNVDDVYASHYALKRSTPIKNKKPSNAHVNPVQKSSDEDLIKTILDNQDDMKIEQQRTSLQIEAILAMQSLETFNNSNPRKEDRIG